MIFVEYIPTNFKEVDPVPFMYGFGRNYPTGRSWLPIDKGTVHLIYRWYVGNTVKAVYNDHLMGYLSAFWNASR